MTRGNIKFAIFILLSLFFVSSKASGWALTTSWLNNLFSAALTVKIIAKVS